MEILLTMAWRVTLVGVPLVFLRALASCILCIFYVGGKPFDVFCLVSRSRSIPLPGPDLTRLVFGHDLASSESTAHVVLTPCPDPKDIGGCCSVGDMTHPVVRKGIDFSVGSSLRAQGSVRIGGSLQLPPAPHSWKVPRSVFLGSGGGGWRGRCARRWSGCSWCKLLAALLTRYHRC